MAEGIEVFESTFRHQIQAGGEIKVQDNFFKKKFGKFDVVYHQVFHANKKRLVEYRNLWPYARDLYQVPEIKESTYFDVYKKHYQLSPHLKPLWGNVYSIVAKGPDVSGWEVPSGRENLSRDPGRKFKLQEASHE
ncbi:hypothetical protein [Lacrimispora brassicae]